MSDDPRPEWLTPPEIAKELRCRTSKPIRWIEAGELPAVNVSEGARPRYRVRRADHRAKNPNRTGWQNLRLTKEDLLRHFNGRPQNIGVLLGGPSGWLVDVDLDCPGAVEAADRQPGGSLGGGPAGIADGGRVAGRGGLAAGQRHAGKDGLRTGKASPGLAAGRAAERPLVGPAAECGCGSSNRKTWRRPSGNISEPSNTWAVSRRPACTTA
jgi:excisionase family DNA binding protein